MVANEGEKPDVVTPAADVVTPATPVAKDEDGAEKETHKENVGKQDKMEMVGNEGEKSDIVTDVVTPAAKDEDGAEKETPAEMQETVEPDDWAEAVSPGNIV